MNLKNKRADGVFGLSFSMIFAIILIVFFVITAFIAIKFFLGFQKKAQIGIFFDTLDRDVKSALNSYSSDEIKKYTLPSGIEDVCFVNLNVPSINANTDEKEIYKYIFDKEGVQNVKNNVYLYAPDSNYGLNWKTINNINTTEKNPICIPITNGVVSIKLERKSEGSSVYVSAA